MGQEDKKQKARLLSSSPYEYACIDHLIHGGVVITTKYKGGQRRCIRETSALDLTLHPHMRVSTDHDFYLAGRLQHPPPQRQIPEICVTQSPVNIMRLAAHLLLKQRNMRSQKDAMYARIIFQPL